MSLSKRLNSCLYFTQGFNKLADIGTDHALLPIEAIMQGYVLSAIAIDNKIGPFGIASNNVKNSNLADKITVLLGDGLDQLDDDVDVVVISGMGGGLIANILKNHSLKNVKRLILQPNNDADMIRKMLSTISYHIVDEVIINEKNKLYDLIVIEPGKKEYTSLEIIFGPLNLVEKSYFFTMRIDSELKRLNTLLNQVSSPDRRISIQARILLLKEALK
ncbi:MAG: tRNA (adenine(22)-N(1))-methyltransferase TrmK [Candidatus Izimaplasma sp.]|nr:tRNA (adenine(22)-N(1))-methyltransferase TrmK [Candidatus Izimaplasma bacterium]